MHLKAMFMLQNTQIWHRKFTRFWRAEPNRHLLSVCLQKNSSQISERDIHFKVRMDNWFPLNADYLLVPERSAEIMVMMMTTTTRCKVRTTEGLAKLMSDSGVLRNVSSIVSVSRLSHLSRWSNGSSIEVSSWMVWWKMIVHFVTKASLQEYKVYVDLDFLS